MQINNLALAARLPTMHGNPENVEAGGLMAYAPTLTSTCGNAPPIIVDKILRGAKPERNSCRAADQVRVSD